MPRKHKPHSRRHVKPSGMTHAEYGTTGVMVPIKRFVNTGKVYANEDFGTNRRKRFVGLKGVERLKRLIERMDADQGV